MRLGHHAEHGAAVNDDRGVVMRARRAGALTTSTVRHYQAYSAVRRHRSRVL